MKALNERLKFLYPRTEDKPDTAATSRRAQRLVVLFILV